MCVDDESKPWILSKGYALNLVSILEFRSSVSLNITGPSAAQAAPATVRSSLPPSNPVNAPNALIPVKVTPAHNKVLGPAANTGNLEQVFT